MKKAYIILTVILLACLFCACGAKEEKMPTATKDPESTVVSESPVQTEPTETPETPDDPIDPDFPVFEVGYYAGKEFILIKNKTELASCLSTLQGLCGEGKPYEGIGVRLHGLEVQKGDVSGLPYCHLSYGTKDYLLTVFGFKYDVLGELNADIVAELLRMCPYFTKAEFYLVADPTSPELVI